MGEPERGEGWDLRREAGFPLRNLSLGRQRAAQAGDVRYDADVSEDGWRKKRQSIPFLLTNISTHVLTGKDRTLNFMWDLIDSCGFHCLTKHS